VPVDLYGTSVYFLIGDLNEAVKIVRRRMGDTVADWLLTSDCPAATLEPDKNYGPHIWVPKLPETCTEFSALVHEMFHASNIILWECGVELTKSGEPFAYLLGYITKEAMIKCAKAQMEKTR
jgi:hypothetical protein